mmetsp:Transcript_2247/g.3586  ORF Transcript_2247/g.3586 Transcript_2247/m.3586 type:complete len:105 (+) Transcript_2247:175-489(+)
MPYFQYCRAAVTLPHDINDITVVVVEAIPRTEPPMASARMRTYCERGGHSMWPSWIIFKDSKAGSTKQTKEDAVLPMRPNTVLMSGINMEAARAERQRTQVTVP